MESTVEQVNRWQPNQTSTNENYRKTNQPKPKRPSMAEGQTRRQPKEIRTPTNENHNERSPATTDGRNTDSSYDDDEGYG